MPNRKTRVELEYPFPDERVFRYQAMQDVLTRLIEEPFTEVTVSELATMVEANQATVSKAVALLAELGVVQTRREGRSRLVSIDRARLHKPDPVFSIPQAEFHRPVQAFLDRIEEEFEDVIGVILFGSVARGDADRASDIDLLIIVEEDKTSARRTVQSIVHELEDQTFEGDRYTFQALVESVESARRIGSRLQEQFNEGITLIGSETLTELRKEVYADGE